MNKKVLLLGTIFFMLCTLFSACGTKDDNATSQKAETNNSARAEEGQNQKQLEVIKKIYHQGNIRVEYPQIINLANQEKQKEINDFIYKEALMPYEETRKELELNQDYEVDGKYEIKYNSPKVLSIAYSSYNNIVPSAHPFELFYTTNINMETGKAILLKDLVPIDKSFVHLLKNAKYIGEIDKEYEPQLRNEAFSQYENDQKLMDLLSSNDIYAYITKDALGISMPISHVMGDHAEFEIKASDLKDYTMNQN